MILIDGDVVAYRAACAAENRYYKDVNTGIKYSRKKDASDPAALEFIRKPLDELIAMETVHSSIYCIVNDIKKILKHKAHMEYKVFLSGDSNFRAHICESYKSSRKVRGRPPLIGFVREFIIKQYDTNVSEDEEADDMLGKMQCHKTIIASIDKDLDMIPGQHYNMKTRSVYTVTSYMAFKNFCTQVLMGDSVDDIPGLPRIGIARANKMLEGIDNPIQLWDTVEKAYEKADMSDQLEMMATLLWIKRRDYHTYKSYVSRIEEKRV